MVPGSARGTWEAVAVAVTVRGLSRLLRPEATLLVMVRCNPAVAERAERVLSLAAQDVRALDGGWRSAAGLQPGDRNGPKFVSEPVPTPLGPMVMADLGSTPRKVLAGIPALVVALVLDRDRLGERSRARLRQAWETDTTGFFRR
jgi:hypothetical protein